MWQRALVTALALTYLICVLSLSGVQKEDLDVSTLQKLKQHNVNLDNLNNDTVHRDCLTNSNVGLSSNKEAASAEQFTPTWHLVATKSSTPKNRELHVTKVPGVEIIKYFETASVQPVKIIDTDVDDSMSIDVHKDKEKNKVTTIAHTATTIRNLAENNSLLNSENLMKFLTMYSNFQQSQMESKVHKEPTTTTPQIEQRTEKSNIFHITINKYIRNESFLEQYYANHQNKTATIKRPDFSSHVMEKIYDFISKKLFANKEELSKEARDINKDETTQVNPAPKSSQERKEDKTTLFNIKTFHEGHETTNTILNKIPPQTLEKIAREVQDFIMKGLIKTTSKPLVVTPNVTSAISNDNNAKHTNKIPSVLIRNVVDDVKKMLMSELWKEPALKGLVITSTTAKAATAKDTLSSTNIPESTDPELDNFIKLFKKFKSWRETSSSSSKTENFEAVSSNNYFKNSEAPYKSSAVKKSKSTGRQQTKVVHRDEFISPQLNDSSEHADTLNPHGYPKLHEKNDVSEDEQKGPDTNLATNLLPYRDFYSGKKKLKKTDVTADGSMENQARNENKHLKNKHTRNKVTKRLQKRLNLKAEPDSNSIEIKYPIKNTGIENQESSLKRNINVKRGFHNNVDPEYSTNHKNENPHDEEVLNSESNGNINDESVSKAIEVRSQNQNFQPLIESNSKSNIKKSVHNFHKKRYSKKNIVSEAGHKISRALEGNFNGFNPYGTSTYPGKNQITDLERHKSLEPNQPDRNLEDQEKEIKNNSGTIYEAYVPQPYTSSSVVNETNMPYIKHNSKVAPVYNKILDQNKIKRNKDFLRNNPVSAYNQYGIPNYSAQNQKTQFSGNIPNQMFPYPYAIPHYSMNKKPNEIQQHMANANTTNAYNPYGVPIYSPVSIIGNAQERIYRAEVNQPSEQGAPNYSGTNNIGDSQDQIKLGATTGNNAISNGYQDSPNYFTQYKIGSIPEAAPGNMPNPNDVATYPYGAPQYSETNKRGDSKSSPVNLPKQQTASNPYSVPNYYTDNNIGGTQEPIPASPLINTIANAGLANPFGGIFSAKIKFPVIQDPRVEALMRNPNINAGPSFNPYSPKMYPENQGTNGQGPMAARLQNPYLRERQEVISGLVPSDANIQNGPISVQNNPYAKPSISYRGQDIVLPRMVTNSIKEAYVLQNNPYTNAQQIAPAAYGGKQPIDVPASGSKDANLPKVKGTQPEPVHLPPAKNENAYNTIAKIYPPGSTKQNDQTSPIMIQTNDDEIMPLGIPIHIKGDSKFHMRLIQNQHIIVTTTSRPRSIVDHWNDYVLSKDGNQEKKKAKHIPPATNHHHNRARLPMTHHDFEDLAPKQEPNDVYRYESKGMRPISEHDIVPMHQYAPEHYPNGQHYTELQENRYPRHRFEKPEKVSLPRKQERMHDSINAGRLTIAQRHQVPLKRPQVNFDDTHFQNFLKTQEKVNEMLERILATRPKNLSLEPFKSR